MSDRKTTSGRHASPKTGSGRASHGGRQAREASGSRGAGPSREGRASRTAAPQRGPHQSRGAKPSRELREPRQSHDAKDKKSRLSNILLVAGILLMVAALVAFGCVAAKYLKGRSAYKSVAEISGLAIEENTISVDKLDIDWDALRAENSEIVGWIIIPGTVVNYPVVQASDNSKYLGTMFSGASGQVGTPFLDMDNNSNFDDAVSLIYGHNMLDGSMFACISKYINQDYFNNHSDVFLATPYANYHLKAVGAFEFSGYDARVRTFNFDSEADRLAAYNALLSRSNAKATDVKAEDIEKMIVLVTCTNQTNDSRIGLCLMPVEVKR